MPKMNFPNHDFMRFKKSQSQKYQSQVQAQIYDNVPGKKNTVNNTVYQMMKSFSTVYRIFNMINGDNMSKTIKTQSDLNQVGRKTYSSYFLRRSKTIDKQKSFSSGQVRVNKKTAKSKKDMKKQNLNKVNDSLDTINCDLNRLKSKLRKNKVQIRILNTFSSKSLQYFQQIHSQSSNTSLQTYKDDKKIIQICRQDIQIGKKKPVLRLKQIQTYQQPKIPLKKSLIINKIKNQQKQNKRIIQLKI